MGKLASPLLGYNHNVRHKSRVFHIQTEDSGVNHPHIITHIFMDGGRILKSVKKSYAEHVGTEGMAEVVRQMMKEQHKALLIALRDGQFDHLVDPNAAQAPGAAAGRAAAGGAAAQTPGAGASALASQAAAAPRAPEPAAGAPSLTPPRPAEPRLIVATPDAEIIPVTMREPGPPAGAIAEAGAVEVERSFTGGGLFQASDLPPAPAKLATNEGAGGTSGANEAAPESVARPAAPPAAASAASAPQTAGRTPSRPPPSSRQGTAERSRYAPARPASIFGSTAKPRAQSIFRSDLVEDKSLDEVILSYLAEDLEPPRRE